MIWIVEITYDKFNMSLFPVEVKMQTFSQNGEPEFLKIDLSIDNLRQWQGVINKFLEAF